MAKKGQAIQLQTEINTDEEWEKYLKKPGVLVIDVYSEWCGPCAGMQANLKKIKVEVGGDLLQLGIAKCDTIDALKRFRGKSEPTWMIISRGKMVNFMYGADAPKLTQIILEELSIENEVLAGTTVREKFMEISDRAPEESVRFEKEQGKIFEEEALEMTKKMAEKKQRLLAESDAILETLGNLSVVIVFPHARDKYMEVMKVPLHEAGLVISSSEKVAVTEEHLEDLFCFAVDEFGKEGAEEIRFPELSLKHILQKGESQVITIKPTHSSGDSETSTVDRVLQMIYGESKEPPGEEDCVYQQLLYIPSVHLIPGLDDVLADEGLPKTGVKDDANEDGGEKVYDENVIIGIWAVPTKRIMTSALKTFFPKLTTYYLIAEPIPPPPYFAVIFETDKQSKVADLMKQYSDDIMRYGVFSSKFPERTELLAKTLKKYDKLEPKCVTDRIVIQLSKKNSKAVFDFALEMPEYMSPNPVEGKKECKVFFPDGYDELDAGEEEEEEESAIPESEDVTKIPSTVGSTVEDTIEEYLEAANEEGEEDDEIDYSEFEEGEGGGGPGEIESNIATVSDAPPPDL